VTEGLGEVVAPEECAVVVVVVVAVVVVVVGVPVA
jgi:hypothetical protein